MSKVFIDARMVTFHPHGIARYVLSLPQAIRDLKNKNKLDHEFHFIINPEQQNASWLDGFSSVVAKVPFLNPKEVIEIPQILKQQGADLYHSTSFSSLVSCPCPYMVTVHDLTHLYFGGSFQKFYYSFLLKPFLRKAKKVLTGTQYSKSELAAWLKIPSQDIFITPYVVNKSEIKISDEQAKRFLTQHGLKPKEFFFCLSNSKPHKNSAFLVSAFQKYLSAKSLDKYPLVLNFGVIETEGPWIKSLQGLSDLEIQILLRNARALVFPSLMEGFGFPPLEALIEGTPVLLSEIPPHKESLKSIVDPAIVFLDPQDDAKWIKALEDFSQTQAEVKSNTVTQILEQFSLSRLSNALDQLYQDVLRP